jgi:hypothetical protein
MSANIYHVAGVCTHLLVTHLLAQGELKVFCTFHIIEAGLELYDHAIHEEVVKLRRIDVCSSFALKVTDPALH